MRKITIVLFCILLLVMVGGCQASSGQPSAALRTELNSKDNTIANLEADLAEKQELIDGLEAEIEQQNETIASLEGTISELNTQIEVLSEATVETTPEPTAPAKQWEIVSIDSKITEKNDVWWKFAWILVIKNDGNSRLVCDATIEFLDADGFVVDDDREYDLIVEAGEEKTFTGYDLVDASVAPDITQTYVKARSQ